MKIVNIALFLLISSHTAQAVSPLPSTQLVKTKLQKELDARGFKEGQAADAFISLIDKHSDRCLADLNAAGNVIVVKTPSGELVVSIGLLSKISRKDWNKVYDAC